VEKREVLSAALVIVGAVLLLVGVGLAALFAVKSPEFLLTEDYHLRRQALELTDSKGKKFSVEPVDVVAIANPFPSPKALKAKTVDDVEDADDAEFTESEATDGK
jgi:hypothetical protein